MNNHDILIGGAGISGLYAALKLKRKFPYRQIHILEQTNKVGGRIKTEKWGNFTMEYGPMRFEPDLQPIFAKLIEELKIDTIEFSPYTSPHEEPDFNKLEISEIIAIKEANDYAPAFALLKYALTSILKDNWDMNMKVIENREEKKIKLKSEAKFNNAYLYEQGIWDVFSCVLSKEAIDFLQNKGTFYHLLAINPNAADMICFMLDIIDTANDRLITIKNGSYEIINRLKEEVDKLGINIIYNSSITEFQDNGSGVVSVMTKSGTTYFCNRLILTLPQKAYDNIKGFKQDIKLLLKNSVILLELFKLFVIFSEPPYDETSIPKANHSACKIPCRELHYDYDKENKLGMIQIYGDFPSINFWSSFLKNKATISPNDVTKNPLIEGHINRSLKKLFPDNDCKLMYYSMINWSNSPYRNGVHFWRPGYKSNEVIENIHKIGNVNICGETFSTYQGFIEGALLTVDKVISTF